MGVTRQEASVLLATAGSRNTVSHRCQAQLGRRTQREKQSGSLYLVSQ